MCRLNDFSSLLPEKVYAKIAAKFQFIVAFLQHLEYDTINGGSMPYTRRSAF